MNKQLSMSFLHNELPEVKTNKTSAVEYQTAYYYDYDDRMTFAEFGGSSTNRVQYTYGGLGRLHVAVTPIDYSTMQEWVDSKETANENLHPYTLLLYDLRN